LRRVFVNFGSFDFSPRSRSAAPAAARAPLPRLALLIFTLLAFAACGCFALLLTFPLFTGLALTFLLAFLLRCGFPALRFLPLCFALLCFPLISLALPGRCQCCGACRAVSVKGTTA
jgi:hypothetical protein